MEHIPAFIYCTRECSFKISDTLLSIWFSTLLPYFLSYLSALTAPTQNWNLPLFKNSTHLVAAPFDQTWKLYIERWFNIDKSQEISILFDRTCSCGEFAIPLTPLSYASSCLPSGNVFGKEINFIITEPQSLLKNKPLFSIQNGHLFNSRSAGMPVFFGIVSILDSNVDFLLHSRNGFHCAFKVSQTAFINCFEIHKTKMAAFPMMQQMHLLKTMTNNVEPRAASSMCIIAPIIRSLSKAAWQNSILR